MASLIHGGDTEGYVLERGGEPLDFSANCNPLGIPESVPPAILAAAAKADRYPDPLCRRLRNAMSEKLGVPADWILCGNGAADLIFRLALAKRPKTALVTAPTFAEYALALDAAGCGVLRYFLEPDSGFNLRSDLLGWIQPGLGMLFLCNPNNPTGLTVEPALLRRILDACRDAGTLLVVDECFNGFLDEPEKHTLRGVLHEYDNLLILDAFTKTYGMAGVRLGYCMTRNMTLLEAMRDAGQPWAVSSLAQAAGLAALAEDAYVSNARALVKTERAFLSDALRRLGIRELSGEANYLFFRAELDALPDKLRQAGILIRDCSNYAGLTRGYYRVAVRPHDENLRLIDALTDILNERQN
jgi:threonine-phosphate decarboxylase